MKYVLAALFLLAALPVRAAHAEITIAAVGPLTGQDAMTGEQMKRGAEAAVADLNKNGGINGQPVRLILKDDACDPKQSVAVANELSSQGVAGIIGPMCSGSAIPASKVYNEEGILMISPSATSPALTTQKFDNVFRTCGSDEQQGGVLADLIHKRFPGKRVAVVHDKTAYGQGLADVVRKNLEKMGQTPALYESISRGERDYGSLISKLKENNIDVLFFGGYHTEAGLIVRQMRNQNLSTVFIGDDDLSTHEFWAITGAAAEGAFMSFNNDPRSRPEAEQVVARMRAAGFDPEGTTLYTYAAVQVLARAFGQAGAADAKKAEDVMHGGTFSTVIGDITFDPKGDVTRPDYTVYRWSKGNYTPVADK